jgi:hypothetical protein
MLFANRSVILSGQNHYTELYRKIAREKKQESQKFLISNRLLLNMKQSGFSDLLEREKRRGAVQVFWKKEFVNFYGGGGQTDAPACQERREAGRRGFLFFSEKRG